MNNTTRIILLVLLSLACADSQQVFALKEGDVTDEMNAKIVSDELRRCPSWIEFRTDEKEFRAGITRLYIELSFYSNTVIRNAIKDRLRKTAKDSALNFRENAKIFAFLRILFDIPVGYVDGVKYSGSWGNPVQGGKIDLLWPFRKDASGELDLIGVVERYYGPPYDPLAEFDELVSIFQRRKFESKMKNMGPIDTQ